MAYQEREARRAWGVGSKVRVFSRSQNKWYDGTITDVIRYDRFYGGESLQVKYGRNAGTGKPFDKTLPRDSPNLKPVSGDGVVVLQAVTGESSGNLIEGKQYECKYGNGKYYSCTLLQWTNGRGTVKWHDGDTKYTQNHPIGHFRVVASRNGITTSRNGITTSTRSENGVNITQTRTKRPGYSSTSTRMVRKSGQGGMSISIGGGKTTTRTW